MFYILIGIGAVLGVMVGRYIPVIPYTYSVYVSVAILAILDTIFGAIASKIKGIGFFGNAILTMMLVYLGIKLNLDIHIAAVVVFVSRMFNNLSIIRRHYIEKMNRKSSKKTK